MSVTSQQRATRADVVASSTGRDALLGGIAGHEAGHGVSERIAENCFV